jgi:hypothetical protein
MIPLLDIPEIVQHYAPYFRSVFSEAALIQFQRYISGLIVSENKTIEGINRLFVVETRNQSSLNRLLTESPFSVEALDEARLELLQNQPETRIKAKGVLSLDDTLLSHYGRCFEKIAWLYDPALRCHTWAHNLVGLHYSDDQTDYPVRFCLWQPADLDRIEAGLRAAGIPIKASKLTLKQDDEQKWRQYLLGLWRRKQNQPEVAALYKSKLTLAEELLRGFVAAHPCPTLPVVFDSWYTQPAFCGMIDKELRLAFVGALAEDALLALASGEETVGCFAGRLRQEHRQQLAQEAAPIFRKHTIRYKGQPESYYSYCRSHRIRNYGRVRLVISHRQADLSDTPKYLISNRLKWQAGGITRIARHRWSIEVYHEEGKAEGLDQYQLRDFEAIYRHVALVAVVYSLLRRAQHDRDLLKRLQRHVEASLDDSPASKRRTTQAQALWSLAVFISASLVQGMPLKEVMAPLLHAIAY